MEDFTSDGRYSPDPLCLPVEEHQIEAAREMLRENKGAQWSAFFSVGMLAGSPRELHNGLVALFMEWEGVPMATICDAFGLSGREAWEVYISEPVSLFCCLCCGDLLQVRDRRELLRLQRTVIAVSKARPGDRGDATLVCGSCTNLRLRLWGEERRQQRLAQQARTAQLRKMPFAEYRVQREWQVRRTAALEKAAYRCQVCKASDVRLDVHHNTYERYGDERSSDLVVLCGGCHELFHGIVEDAS